MSTYGQEKELESGKDDVLTVLQDSDSTKSFVEGGWKGWSAVLGVWLVQFCTFGYTNGFGVFTDFYVREYLVQTSTSSQVGWIGSVQLFLVLSSGLVSGRAFDAGYFHHLMIGGSLLFVFSLFMSSLSQPEHFYQVFLTQGLGLGLAIGIMYIPALGIISHYFQKRRALAFGLATSGSAIGGAIHPIMLNAWLHGPLGYHKGVRASAGLCGGVLLIALFLMKPRYPENHKKGQSTLSNFRVFLRDIPYVVMIIGTTIILSGLYYPIFFLQLNAIKNGINPNLAFYTLAIMNAASGVGRILPNMLVPRFGAFNVVIFSVYVTALLIFCTLGIHTAFGTMLFAILFGFFSGSYASVLPAMVSSTAESDSEIGARLGVCFTFTGFGGLVGTPIAGALLSTQFIWWRPTVFSGMAVFGGATCFLITRCMRASKKGTQWL